MYASVYCTGPYFPYLVEVLPFILLYPMSYKYTFSNLVYQFGYIHKFAIDLLLRLVGSRAHAVTH